MNKLVKTGLVLTGLLAIAAFTSAPVRFTMTPQSKLWVEGTSTVHDWTCEATTFDGQLDALSDAVENVQGAAVRVPTKALECKNGTMNKKALDALKADKAPTISYALTSATPSGTDANGAFTLDTKGQLTIAGKTLPVTMTVTGEKGADGRLHFKGQVPVLMSDFGITPPTAMLGTMKTGDKVVVGFDIIAAR